MRPLDYHSRGSLNSRLKGLAERPLRIPSRPVSRCLVMDVLVEKMEGNWGSVFLI